MDIPIFPRSLILAAALLAIAHSASAQPRPEIVVLATGGTIAGAADVRSAAGYNAGAVSAEQLVASVPGLDKVAKLQTEQISSIGSQDMNDEVWLKLARRIEELDKSADVQGIVITHGTDTMEETAFFLDHVVKGEKPVVMVGSMRPSSAISADGPLNLLEAVMVAADPDARGRGVMVVLNDQILGARDVTKTNTTAVDTFRAPNIGPIGTASPDGVRFYMPPQRRDIMPVPATSPLPRVDIIYAHSNMTADMINDAVKGGAKGIVLAGVGDGNASKAAIEALAAASKQGVVVVRSSRVGSGPVLRNIEVDDDKLGFVAAYELNPAKARVLLQLLLASGIGRPAAVQNAFANALAASPPPKAAQGQ
jgi:L-asparaginase